MMFHPKPTVEELAYMCNYNNAMAKAYEALTALRACQQPNATADSYAAFRVVAEKARDAAHVLNKRWTDFVQFEEAMTDN
jgi:hypothetical protein